MATMEDPESLARSQRTDDLEIHAAFGSREIQQLLLDAYQGDPEIIETDRVDH